MRRDIDGGCGSKLADLGPRYFVMSGMRMNTPNASGNWLTTPTRCRAYE